MSPGYQMFLKYLNLECFIIASAFDLLYINLTISQDVILILSFVYRLIFTEIIRFISYAGEFKVKLDVKVINQYLTIEQYYENFNSKYSCFVIANY